MSSDLTLRGFTSGRVVVAGAVPPDQLGPDSWLRVGITPVARAPRFGRPAGSRVVRCSAHAASRPS